MVLATAIIPAKENCCAYEGKRDQESSCLGMVVAHPPRPLRSMVVLLLLGEVGQLGWLVGAGRCLYDVRIPLDDVAAEFCPGPACGVSSVMMVVATAVVAGPAAIVAIV